MTVITEGDNTDDDYTVSDSDSKEARHINYVELTTSPVKPEYHLVKVGQEASLLVQKQVSRTS